MTDGNTDVKCYQPDILDNNLTKFNQFLFQLLSSKSRNPKSQVTNDLDFG